MAGSVRHDDGGHAGHSRRHWTYWIAPHRSTKLTAPTLTHKGSGGCKSWITIETTTVALFSSLKSMHTTSSKHRSRPPSAILSSRVAIGVSKLCSFAYREAHSEPILSTSRERWHGRRWGRTRKRPLMELYSMRVHNRCPIHSRYSDIDVRPRLTDSALSAHELRLDPSERVRRGECGREERRGTSHRRL